eukprot:1264923-Prymnesium_polylepis.1
MAVEAAVEEAAVEEAAVEEVAVEEVTVARAFAGSEGAISPPDAHLKRRHNERARSPYYGALALLWRARGSHACPNMARACPKMS